MDQSPRSMTAAVAPQRGEGLVLICDPSGRIIDVLRDDPDCGCAAGAAITDFMDPGSRNKAMRFLEAIARDGAAVAWELAVAAADGPRVLEFAGGRGAEGLMIMGAQGAQGDQRIEQLVGQFMEMHNEQANAIRRQMKQRVQAGDEARAQAEKVSRFAELNSELTTMQRAVAKKNAELEAANRQLRQTQEMLQERERELVETNAQLAALATHDELTGLQNRRALQQVLNEERARAERQQLPLSALMIDVDRFKSFNDQFGHPAGDQVLKLVASILNREARQFEYVARWGGEEFAIVLVGADSDDARIAAERFRAAVEAHDWAQRSVTVSIGAATLCEATGDGDALIAAADAALYESKRAGRNRVTHADD